MKAESREPRAESPLWDGFSAHQLAASCNVPTLHLFDDIGSTLDVAHTLAEQGALSGTTVLADAQHAGRGRMGRTWSSHHGVGVWCTVIERVVPSEALDVLSLRVGLEIAERMDALAGKPVGVKWPNDLMLDGGKLGGVLVEARWAGDRLGWVAIGVGVNVLGAPDVPGSTSLSPRLKPRAESREPRAPRRFPALMAIVAGIRAAASATGHLSAQEMTRYGSRDTLRGKQIVEPLAGAVSGIAANGALVVETEKGTQHVRTGTIRLAEGR
ncbi:MAG TPA: biotin--[acetyl-CoA-carboxylase] ligase [Gemmatimonadaceae bacterium]